MCSSLLTPFTTLRSIWSHTWWTLAWNNLTKMCRCLIWNWRTFAICSRLRFICVISHHCMRCDVCLSVWWAWTHALSDLIDFSSSLMLMRWGNHHNFSSTGNFTSLSNHFYRRCSLSCQMWYRWRLQITSLMPSWFMHTWLVDTRMFLFLRQYHDRQLKRISEFFTCWNLQFEIDSEKNMWKIKFFPSTIQHSSIEVWI